VGEDHVLLPSLSPSPAHLMGIREEREMCREENQDEVRGDTRANIDTRTGEEILVYTRKKDRDKAIIESQPDSMSNLDPVHLQSSSPAPGMPQHLAPGMSHAPISDSTPETVDDCDLPIALRKGKGSCVQYLYLILYHMIHCHHPSEVTCLPCRP
jgi:hypothetical protein